MISLYRLNRLIGCINCLKEMAHILLRHHTHGEDSIDLSRINICGFSNSSHADFKYFTTSLPIGLEKKVIYIASSLSEISILLEEKISKTYSKLISL